MRAKAKSYSYSLNMLYKEAETSKQAVHQYIQRENIEEKKLLSLLHEVDTIRLDHPGCGVEKMYYMLKPDWIGRDKFIDIIMELGYRVNKPKNYIRTTYSIKSHYYPNLITGMQIMSINTVWQTDITYFQVGDKFCYITFIIDVYSRRIIGYYASDSLRAEANIKALNMALSNRKGMDLSNLIHHSDRGGQYIDNNYTILLKKNDISISMCEKPQDNAYTERVNGTIKNEYLKYKSIKTITELRRELKKAVNHYNNKRIHNSLINKLSPMQFEEKVLTLCDQKRPKVIIYAEGNVKIKERSNLLYFRPEEEPQAHNCPIVMFSDLLTKTVNVI